MRALCGAIITAGALIGLGLTALGIGTRYVNVSKPGGDPHDYVHFGAMDSGLLFCLWFFVLLTLIGLAIATVGLMFHHHRRHHEMLRHYQNGAGVTAPRTTV
jgi:hypothetical protein